jgi:purine-binding chemotaxis protein CheW
MGAAQREHMLVLVFDVDGEAYGIDAKRVQEIVRAVLPTRLPAAPRVITGVINFRGEVVPLIDLRARFGAACEPVRRSDVFVILQRLRGNTRRIALRADGVRELRRIPQDCLVPMQETAPGAAYAVGTLLLPNGVLLLCDVEAFLDEAERLTLTSALREFTSEAGS